MLEQRAMPVGRIVNSRGSHGCRPARTTEGSLPCGRNYLAPLAGNEEGGKGLWYSANSCILYKVCDGRGALHQFYLVIPTPQTADSIPEAYPGR